MLTIFYTMLAFLAVILLMSIGVMVHGRRLKGSCGGVGGVCACKSTGAITCDTRRKQAESAAS